SAEVVLRDRPGSLHLVIPSLFVRLASETVVANAESGTATGGSSSLLEAICSASVRVDAVLHGSGIKIQDLLAFRHGSVLLLPPPAGAALEGQVNGLVKLRGCLISDGRSTAFELIETPGAGAEIVSSS